MSVWVAAGWVSTNPEWIDNGSGSVVIPAGRAGRVRRVPVFDYGQDSISNKAPEREYEAIAIFTQPAATWDAAMSVERSQEWRDMEALLGLGGL